MTPWEMQQAINEARQTLDAADSLASQLAVLLAGRCQKVRSYAGEDALAAIKKELSRFDSRTKTWK